MSATSPSGPLCVLVTDGSYKHTLGIVRSLGKRGHRVCVVASTRFAPALHSRFCARRAIVHDPTSEPEGFIADMARLIQRWHVDCLIPVGFAAIDALTHRPAEWRIEGVNALLPSGEEFDRASDKWQMIDAARAVGLIVPKSCLPNSLDEARAFLQQCGDDCVMKFRRESLGKGSKRIQSEDQLRAALEQTLRSTLGVSYGDIILQEYVPGHGAGFMALAIKGRTVREFAHRRLREMPATGGYATAAESIDDEAIIAAGRQLISALRWSGVAMVEFRVDGTTRNFIEFNPKFWGSLDLALLSGADFPGDLCRLTAGENLADRERAPYTVGQRAWWPWRGDIRRLLQQPGDIRYLLRDLFTRRSRSNWRWSDPIPNLLEIGGELTHRWRHPKDA